MSTFKVLELPPTTPILIGEEGETPNFVKKDITPKTCVKSIFKSCVVGDNSGTPWYTYRQMNIVRNKFHNTNNQ